MKNFSLVVLLCVLVSCSGGGGQPKVTAGGLSSAQVQAQSLIAQDLQPLRENQYNITDEDLQLLQREGLISPEEQNSLSVVR